MHQAASLSEALTTDGPFDAIVVGDGFEELNDPIEALKVLAKLLAEAGLLIVVADNIGHASVRLKALLGQSDVAGALPLRRYDLPAIERVIAEAGLHVSERLRVLETVSAETLEAAAPGLSAVITGDDAATRQFVVVATRADAAPAGETVAEAMQRQLTTLTAQVAELDAVRNELAAANATLADQAIELEARKDALVERIELIERLYAERRHLELEIVVKDDYISILRRDRNEWRNIHAALEYEMGELKRSRTFKVAEGIRRGLGKIPFARPAVLFVTKRVMAARRRGA